MQSEHHTMRTYSFFTMENVLSFHCWLAARPTDRQTDRHTADCILVAEVNKMQHQRKDVGSLLAAVNGNSVRS